MDIIDAPVGIFHNSFPDRQLGASAVHVTHITVVCFKVTEQRHPDRYGSIGARAVRGIYTFDASAYFVFGEM